MREIRESIRDELATPNQKKVNQLCPLVWECFIGLVISQLFDQIIQYYWSVMTSSGDTQSGYVSKVAHNSEDGKETRERTCDLFVRLRHD